MSSVERFSNSAQAEDRICSVYYLKFLGVDSAKLSSKHQKDFDVVHDLFETTLLQGSVLSQTLRRGMFESIQQLIVSLHQSDQLQPSEKLVRNAYHFISSFGANWFWPNGSWICGTCLLRIFIL